MLQKWIYLLRKVRSYLTSMSASTSSSWVLTNRSISKARDLASFSIWGLKEINRTLRRLYYGGWICGRFSPFQRHRGEENTWMWEVADVLVKVPLWRLEEGTVQPCIGTWLLLRQVDLLPAEAAQTPSFLHQSSVVLSWYHLARWCSRLVVSVSVYSWEFTGISGGWGKPKNCIRPPLLVLFTMLSSLSHVCLLGHLWFLVEWPGCWLLTVFHFPYLSFWKFPLTIKRHCGEYKSKTFWGYWSEFESHFPVQCHNYNLLVECGGYTFTPSVQRAKNPEGCEFTVGLGYRAKYGLSPSNPNH